MSSVFRYIIVRRGAGTAIPLHRWPTAAMLAPRTINEASTEAAGAFKNYSPHRLAKSSSELSSCLRTASVPRPPFPRPCSVAISSRGLS